MSKKDRIGELYELMEELSEEHDADNALIEKRGDGTAAVVLEYDIDGDASTGGDSSVRTRDQRR